jgi:hypothetical protein
MQNRRSLILFLGTAALAVSAGRIAGSSVSYYLALALACIATGLLATPVATAVATGVGLAFGDRLLQLHLGSGPRLGTYVSSTPGAAPVAVHLLPFRLSAQVDLPSLESYRRYCVVLPLAPLPLGLAAGATALSAHSPYAWMALLGWAWSTALWLLLPNTPGTRRSRLGAAIAVASREEPPPPGLKPVLIDLALASALSGRLDRIRADLERYRAAAAPEALVEGVTQILALIEGDYAGLVDRATAALDREWGDEWTEALHEHARQRLLDALPRAAEAGALPPEQAVARLDELLARYPSPAPDSSRAIRATLVGEWAEAALLARRAVRADCTRMSLADELCTLAVAESGHGRPTRARSAWARARRIAPHYPRVATVRALLEQQPASDGAVRPA